MNLWSAAKALILPRQGTPEREYAVHVPDPDELVEWWDQDTIKGVHFETVTTKDLIGDRIAAGQAGQQLAPDGVTDLIGFYETALYVYRAVFAIANNLAAVPMIATLRQQDGTVEDQPDSELQVLLDNPAEGMTQSEFVETAISYLALAGSEPIFIERMTRAGAQIPDDDPSGLIRWFRPLRPTRVKILTPRGAAQIKDSVMGVYRYVHDVNGKETQIHPLNVAMMKQFNPSSDYWGLGAAAVARRSIIADDTLMNLNVTQLERGGVPDAALETADKMSLSVARRTKHDWEQRFSPGNSGGVIILSNGLKVKPLGFSNKDMEYAELADRVQRRLMAAYGVPPLYYMDLRDASVLANSETQKEVFFGGTLGPYGQRLVNVLTRALKTDERFNQKNEQWGIRFAWDQVEILTDSRLKKREQARNDYTAGGLTKNEYRREIGVGPTEEGGDEFFSPPQPTLTFGAPGADEKTIKVRPEATEEFKAMARSAHRMSFKSAQQDMDGTIADFFADQRSRVITAVRAHFNLGKGAKTHRSSNDFADESLLASIFPLDEEHDRIRDEFGPVFLSTFLDAANERQLSLFPDASLEALGESNASVSSFMEDWSANKVTRINEETMLSLRDTLVQSFAEGWSPNRLTEEIGKQFQGWGDEPADGHVSRAQRIARTETNTALNAGAYAAAVEAEDGGAQLLKSWLSSRDGLVRKSHKLMDQLTTSDPIALRTTFPNGLKHPGDPGGPAAEVVSCRCSQIEIVKKEPE